MIVKSPEPAVKLPPVQPRRHQSAPSAAISVRRRPLGRRLRPWAVAAALTVISALFILPFLWALLTAIKPFHDAFTFPPTWNFTPTFNSFSKLYLETDFVAIFGNTVFVAVLTMVVSLAIAAPAAYAMSRHSGRIGAWLIIIALVFHALPRFAVVLPFYDTAQALGIYDTPGMLIVALVAVNLPFTLWLLRNFFATIPTSLDEAAQIDGCGPLRGFFHIILPLSVPGLVTAGIFTLLLAYQEYLIPLALTQTNAQTISVFVSSIGVKQDVSSLQTLAASNVALAIPVIFLALFAQRYLVSGLTAGSVK